MRAAYDKHDNSLLTCDVLGRDIERGRKTYRTHALRCGCGGGVEIVIREGHRSWDARFRHVADSRHPQCQAKDAVHEVDHPLNTALTQVAIERHKQEGLAHLAAAFRRTPASGRHDEVVVERVKQEFRRRVLVDDYHVVVRPPLGKLPIGRGAHHVLRSDARFISPVYMDEILDRAVRRSWDALRIHPAVPSFLDRQEQGLAVLALRGDPVEGPYAEALLEDGILTAAVAILTDRLMTSLGEFRSPPRGRRPDEEHKPFDLGGA